MEKERNKKVCEICGKEFAPNTEADTCCSPFCRTVKATREIAARRKQEEDAKNAGLDSMESPPKFDLSSNPRARVEWFMSLPDSFKSKFRCFLSPQELGWVREISQKILAEDRFFSGIYVRHGKVIDTKSASSEEEGEGETQERTDDPDDWDNFD